MNTTSIEVKTVAPTDAEADYDAIISLWHSVNAFFTNYKLQTESGVTKVNIDVNQVLKTILNLKPENCEKYFKNLMSNNNFASQEAFFNHNPLGAVILIQTDDQALDIDRFLQQLFLAMNISHCGSCNLLDYKITNDGPFTFLDNRKTLTASLFDDVITTYRNNSWPKIHRLEFSSVWNWLEKHNLRSIQLAKTPVQKSCAVLINLSSSELHYAELLLGITQVLESILLKNGEPKSYNLSIKIEAILGHNSKERNWVRKLYNLRSSIIHGEHDIFWPGEYPLSSDDSEEEQHLNTINESFALGASTLVSLLQDLIISDKVKYNFTNRLLVEKI